MIHARSLAELAAGEPGRPSLLTIGSFDGIHLGHQSLIRSLVETARASNHRAAVVTFFPHPLIVLRGPLRDPSFYLNTPEEKAHLFEQLGMDCLVTQTFDLDFAKITAAEFIAQLKAALHFQEIWCGPDFAFGHNREGTVEWLKTHGRENGFGVRVIDPAIQSGDVISSSRIRRALADGDVALAASCMGRPYQLPGIVVEGDRRGRAIGVPTANLQTWNERAHPARGVYACRAWVRDEPVDAVANIGVRPTFETDSRPTVEAHLLDFDADLYGQTLRLDFIARLRPEKKFNGPAELIAQIKTDITAARSILEKPSPPRSIYLLSPRSLSPETIAVTFAKTSRSPQSFREIAAELTEAKSAEFHERWVVGYGHASVAEHAVLHLAFENVSRLAIEAIESNRLASYTEKSTRYQKWDPESFYTPRAVAESSRAALYADACRMLFDAYRRSLDPVKRWVESQAPRREGESDEKYDGRIRSRYVDNCRFILPAASLANVGMTANARVFEHAIRKMLSHPLEEVREIGEEVKRVAQEETPTLVKYANRVPYLAELQISKPKIQTPNSKSQKTEWLTLVDYDRDGETKFLAAVLYRFSDLPFADALEVVRGMDASQRESLANDALGKMSLHDIPLRELEHVAYTFDTLMDQGGYFEVKRHRMMTQTPQRLTATLGWATPRAFEAAGFAGEYGTAMEAAATAYRTLAADFPEEASYVVPNAFNRRTLMTMNLREAFAFCELRTAANAHFSVRRAAARVVEHIRGVHPLLAKFMRCSERPSAETIEEEFLVNAE